MQNVFLPSTSSDFQEKSVASGERDVVRERMHALANKLLPITVFSQLALRYCQDPQILKHLEKIHLAAEEARVIVTEIQHLEQSDLPSSTTETLSDES